MRRFLQHFERIWCISMHGAISWPVRGHYHCQTCLREYPVTFEA